MPAEFPPNPAERYARGQNKMWRKKSGILNESGLSRSLRHIFFLATYPVRLQASLSVATFTWGFPRLIRHLSASLISGVTPWHSSRASGQPLARTGPMALGSSMGCSVPQDRRLLWPYPSFCTPPGGLMIMSAWSCACAPAAEVPQFTLPVLCDVPSSVLRWFQQVLLTISSLPMLSSQHLQGARQPRVPRQSRTNGVSSRSCNVRFMLRPARSACPALVRTFTSELSQEGSPPKPASDITSWLIVYYHSRIFPGRTGSLMGCGRDWTFIASTWSRTSSRTSSKGS